MLPSEVGVGMNMSAQGVLCFGQSQGRDSFANDSCRVNWRLNNEFDWESTRGRCIRLMTRGIFTDKRK